jgi:predicted nucleic acid-binding protein
LRRRAASWTEVVASTGVREQAIRLIRVHELRSGDALQLAAAIVAADFQPSSLAFVTFDTRQGEAADKEGFRVIAPS